jgi:hypothetical protein
MENGIEVGIQMRSLTTGTGIGVKMAIITEMNLGIKILNVTGIEIMGRRNTKLMITGGFWIQKQNS